MSQVFNHASWPIRYHITPSYLAIRSAQPMAIVSSAIVSPSSATAIVNRYVDKTYSPPDPVMETKEWLANKGFPSGETVTLLTSALVENGSKQVTEKESYRLAVFATAGVGNATRSGLEGPTYPYNPPPGTINIILIIDGMLIPQAMVNAIITATEAKTAALQDLHIKTSSGHLATGTNTDAIVVAATQQPKGNYIHHYAGVASPLGQAIGQLTFQAVYAAVSTEKTNMRANRFM